MSVCSPRGLLAVLLCILALATLWLLSASDPAVNAELGDTAYYTRQLMGWRTVSAVLALGLGVWVTLASFERAVGPRWSVPAVVVLAVVFGLPTFYSWEDAYWDTHGWDRAAVTGPTPTWSTLAGSSWRGSLGGECGYYEAFDLTFDTDSTATGRALPMYVHPLGTLTQALGRLDGPDAKPIRAVVRRDTLWIDTLDGQGPFAVEMMGLPVVADDEPDELWVCGYGLGFVDGVDACAGWASP